MESQQRQFHVNTKLSTKPRQQDLAIMFLGVAEVAALDHDRNCRYNVIESVGSCVTSCDTRVFCAAIRIFTVSIISDPNNFTINECHSNGDV
jgi:hypothetical protein